MMRWLINRVNVWVFLGAILVAGGLVVLIGLLVYFMPVQPLPSVQAGLTMIPAPTFTATPTKIIETPTATPPPSVGGISVGNYVQIAGTDGAGLRLRSGAGTSHEPRFLGMDSEVFIVKEGPQESDGYIWWFLEAPYDPSRSGWAASQYLAVVSAPTPTP